MTRAPTLWIMVSLAALDGDGAHALQNAQTSTAHYVAQGRTGWSGWGSSPDFYCQSDDRDQAQFVSSRHGYDIGVGCCSHDGTTGARPDCTAHPATYDEAEAICSSAGYRLCTLQEMLSEVTAGKGCWYNAAYQWVSDPCDLAAASVDDAAPNNADGSADASGSDGASQSSIRHFSRMTVGAAVGALVIVGIAGIVVVLAKGKRSGTNGEDEMVQKVGRRRGDHLKAGRRRLDSQ